MPRRRDGVGRRYAISADVLAAALDRAAWIAHWGGREAAATAWEALRWDPALSGCDPYAELPIADEPDPRAPAA